MSFHRREYERPGIIETLIGWLFALLAILVLLGIVIELLIPLLPWVGATLILGLGVRWWLYRTSRW